MNRYFFDCSCDGMLYAIKRAASPNMPDWTAYIGYVVPVAVYYAKHVMREAQKHGLYPTTKQLEDELQRMERAA